MPEKKRGKAPMDLALRYLDFKPRTVREMEDYLDSQQYGEFEVSQVVERLKELGYLDDEKYAAEFVRSRLASKAVSRRKLKQQLYAHSLPKEVIEEAVREVPDETEADNAAAVAEKFRRQYEALPQREREEKIAQRLLSRGYDTALIRAYIQDQRIAEELE